MVSSPTNPALQLFHQEQQELLEQIGHKLTGLTETSGSDELLSLRRLVRLIHQGAVQMQISEIAQHTTDFLEQLQPHFKPPGSRLTQEQIQTFTQVFHQLQDLHFTLPHLQINHDAGTKSEDLTSPIEQQQQPQTTPNFFNDDPAPSEKQSQAEDIYQLLLKHDIAEAIAQLETYLSERPDQSATSDIVTQLEALVGWGEVLDWPDLVTLTRTLITEIHHYPEAIAALISVGFLGIKALYNEFTLKSQATPLSAKAYSPQNQKQSLAIDTRNTTVQNISSDKKFIWQSDQLLFMVDSDAIAETLMPVNEDMVWHDKQKFLQWNNRLLQVVNIRQLLENSGFLDQPFKNKPESFSTPPTSPCPVLLLSWQESIIAIEIEPDTFIRVKELEVVTNQSTEQFYVGTTSLNGQLELHLIDTYQLLAFQYQPTQTDLSKISSARIAPSPPDLKSTSHSDSLLASPPTQPSDQKIDTPHILVVDDSRTIRYLLKQLLEKNQYRVTLAQDGSDALEKLALHPDIKLMVSDLEMPNLNGFELMSRCRKQELWRQLPIIILSQSQAETHPQLSEQFGANAYLPKPFEQPAMLNLIHSLLKHD